MKVVITESYEKLSRMAADIIAGAVREKPDCVLGLATGSSPVGTYRELIRRYKNGETDFSRVKTVNLDEYVGLAPDHPQSYRFFMDKNLFDSINIDKANTRVPDGLAADTAAFCEEYDAYIASLGGIDVQLLGIGVDGHIGFNEPGDCFIAGTHVAELDDSTIEANSRFFESRRDVPRTAITMGMKSILCAKKIVLIASGENKKNVLLEALHGDVTPKVPASVLQLHPDVTVIYSDKI